MIGSHVVDELLKTDVAEVIVYDNFFRGSLDNLAAALEDPRVSVFPHGGDILHREISKRPWKGSTASSTWPPCGILQCHEYPETAFEVNVRGTFNVVMAAIRERAQRVVYSSPLRSTATPSRSPWTRTIPTTTSPSTAPRRSPQAFFQELGPAYGLNWVRLRYMNVYGPRQDYKGAYIAVMHKILDRIERGESPLVYGDGSQQYDFVHVANVARANVLAMKADAEGQCYNVGRGVGTTIKELTDSSCCD